MTMETYSSRASSLFTTFTTVLFVIATLNHITSYFHSPSPNGSISISKDSKLEYSEFKPYKADQVRFEIDMNLDLSTEYNWNLNQVYLFVVASYETKKNAKNEVVVYDKILRTEEDLKFALKKSMVKYPLRDEFRKTLAGKEVTLSIRYQLMPIFGLMRISELPNKAKLVVPSEYNAGDSKPKTKKKTGA